MSEDNQSQCCIAESNRFVIKEPPNFVITVHGLDGVKLCFDKSSVPLKEVKLIIMKFYNEIMSL